MTAYDEIEALNWSTIKHLATSPLMLRWRADHPRPDTDALELGTWIHCASLERDRWRREYIAAPDFGDLRTNTGKAARAAWLAKLTPNCIARPYFDVRTKAGKSARADFEATNHGATIIIGDEPASAVLGPGIKVVSADDHALVERCAASVMAHPVARRLLESGRREEIVTWTDDETGIACKARLDLIAPLYILDLKSTRQQTVRAMLNDVARLLYHGQLAMYHDGAVAARLIPSDASGPYAILVQTVEPYDVVPWRMTPEDLSRGRSLYRSLLRRYVDCEAAGWWPGLAPDLIDSYLPAWAPSGEQETDGEW